MDFPRASAISFAITSYNFQLAFEEVFVLKKGNSEINFYGRKVEIFSSG